MEDEVEIEVSWCWDGPNMWGLCIVGECVGVFFYSMRLPSSLSS